jgi:nucleoid DNA-binding protein
MGSTLTKLDIVRELSEKYKKYGVTVAATRRVVDGVFEAVRRALAEGKRIEVRNFGVFKVVDRAPRVARNPQTGERRTVPARKAIKFVAGRGIQERLQALRGASPPAGSTPPHQQPSPA